jgi:hypothetical protein
MKQFKDNAGRLWQIAINVTSIKRVRDLARFDLLDVVKPGSDAMARLMDDPILLVDVLWCLCAEQAKQANVSDGLFGEAMAGDAIDAGNSALLEELADFFRLPSQRTAIRKVLAKGRLVSDAVLARATAEIEAIDVDAVARKLLTPGSSSTTSPASSASTPAP